MKAILYFFSLLGLFALIGCKTTVNSVERSQALAMPSNVSTKVILNDKSLSKNIDILQVNEGVVSGDILKVQAVLMNTKSSPVSFDYSFEWIDSNGMMVSSPGQTWKQARLMGKETKAISAVAPSPSVVDFVLKLKEPSKSK